MLDDVDAETFVNNFIRYIQVIFSADTIIFSSWKQLILKSCLSEDAIG